MMRFPVCAATRIVRLPLHRMQSRGAAAGYALEVSKAEVENLMLKPDTELAAHVYQNQHAMHFLQSLKMIGTVQYRLNAIRFIMGDQLHSLNMDKAVESAEEAAEQAQDQGLLQVRAASDMRTMREQLVWLLKQIEREVNEKSRWPWSSVQVKESSKDYSKGVGEIVLPILEMLKDLGMPDKDQINVAYKQAEGLFKTVVTKCISELNEKAYADRLGQANQILSDARCTSDDAEKHLEAVREKLHKAEADVGAMEEQAKRLLGSEEELGNKISAAKRELQEIEGRVRTYTWRQWGPWVEMWKRDVELAKTEQSEKLKEIANLEEKLQSRKDRHDYFAKIGGEKAQTVARCKVIQDELQMADKSAKNAREKVKSAEAALGKIWSEIQSRTN